MAVKCKEDKSFKTTSMNELYYVLFYLKNRKSENEETRNILAASLFNKIGQNILNSSTNTFSSIFKKLLIDVIINTNKNIMTKFMIEKNKNLSIDLCAGYLIAKAVTLSPPSYL